MGVGVLVGVAVALGAGVDVAADGAEVSAGPGVASTGWVEVGPGKEVEPIGS